VRIVVDGLSYPIVVSDEAPAEAAAIVRRKSRRSIVVSDRNVESRGALVTDALKRAGCDVLGVNAIEAGERRKQWKSVAELHTLFLKSGVERGSVVVAVGGGTLTDTVGFAAATYMRGIRWVAVPTTVLGMVDAAIGGKTGIDRPEGKNLIGAIWQPAGVVADLEALATLSLAHRKTGISEVIKAAVIGDPELLEAVDQVDLASPPIAWAHIIARAAGVKARVVALDPEDHGARAVLNLGHTFAHAIEQASKYRIVHGAAVALGLRAAGVLARDRTGWSYVDHHRVLKALRRAGLRVAMPKLSTDHIVEAMRFDKKRRDGVLKFVLPVRLGEVRAGVDVPDSDVRMAITTLATRPVRGSW
jgi:3-dehydroquinate synthase